ncbi:MAG: hypothetical protein ACOX3T_08115 [Bdellovibrionota bacterium]
MNIVDYVIDKTNKYIQSKSKESRKPYCQFFTSKEVAVFMASLFTLPSKKEIYILDPGAGTGILSASLIERINKFSNIEKVNLICYEMDKEIIEALNDNLSFIKNEIGKKINYSIINENYITSQS